MFHKQTPLYKQIPKMKTDELINWFEWASHIGFYHIAKDVYEELVKRNVLVKKT